MSALPKSQRFAVPEPSLGPTVQTINEEYGDYESESDTSIRRRSSKSAPGRFLESYDIDHERASRSRGNRPSRRRDHGLDRTHSIHAPSSAAYPPGSMHQFSTYDGSYMEPRGGQLRPYYKPPASYNPVHASPVAANGGPSYHAYHASNLRFANPGYPVSPYPATAHHTNLHGENLPYPGGAYYAGDHQHNHLHTTTMHPSDNSGYMHTYGSSHNPPLDSGYGSPTPDGNEAEQMRRELEAFKMNQTTEGRQRAKERNKEREREIEKKKEEERNIRREERARAKQRKKEKEDADEIKERLAHLTQQMAEVQASIYQEKHKKETRNREALLDHKRIAFDNMLRDYSQMLSTQPNTQFDPQNSRRLQGTEQMLQQIVGYLERLWGEHNIPRSDFERLMPREILARRPSIETDRSETVHRSADTNIQRQIEEITMNYLNKVFEDSYGSVPNLPLALRRGSSASDFWNRSSVNFDIPDHAEGISKVGSSSSQTAVNITPANGDLLSSKFNEIHSHPRRQEKLRKKHNHKSKPRKSNPPQKGLSKPKRSRGQQFSASQDSEDFDSDSSDGELDESDENTDENSEDNDDYDGSSSEMEEPPSDSRRKKGKDQKPKRDSRLSRKATKAKQQRGKPKHRRNAAYVEDEAEETQDEWKRKKPSRYAHVPPPVPHPPDH